MASPPMQVNLTLTVPPVALRLPLASDPSLSTTVSPPLAHWGPGPVHMRLISHELRHGQVRRRGDQRRRDVFSGGPAGRRGGRERDRREV